MGAHISTMRILVCLLLALGAVTALPTTADFDFPKVPEFSMPAAQAGSSKLPTVFMHGMGDSCFNPGMKSITEAVGKHLGTYSVCIPTGPDLDSDTNNGFFMTMNDNVDVFAKAIKNNTNLAGGFNAVGFSQGNSIVRGYIQKYNDPAVSTFLSVHGTVVGVASFPKCNPSGLLGPVCKLISRFLVGPVAKTKRWAMIKAVKDTMIYPNDGEWWGSFDVDGKTRLAMNQTDWYKKDLFGLKTADQAGKIMFDTSPGDHLQFTEQELYGWVDKYLLE